MLRLLHLSRQVGLSSPSEPLLRASSRSILSGGLRPSRLPVGLDLRTRRGWLINPRYLASGGGPPGEGPVRQTSPEEAAMTSEESFDPDAEFDYLLDKMIANLEQQVKVENAANPEATEAELDQYLRPKPLSLTERELEEALERFSPTEEHLEKMAPRLAPDFEQLAAYEHEPGPEGGEAAAFDQQPGGAAALEGDDEQLYSEEHGGDEEEADDADENLLGFVNREGPTMDELRQAFADEAEDELAESPTGLDAEWWSSEDEDEDDENEEIADKIAELDEESDSDDDVKTVGDITDEEFEWSEDDNDVEPDYVRSSRVSYTTTPPHRQRVKEPVTGELMGSDSEDELFDPFGPTHPYFPRRQMMDERIENIRQGVNKFGRAHEEATNLEFPPSLIDEAAQTSRFRKLFKTPEEQAAASELAKLLISDEMYQMTHQHLPDPDRVTPEELQELYNILGGKDDPAAASKSASDFIFDPENPLDVKHFNRLSSQDLSMLSLLVDPELKLEPLDIRTKHQNVGFIDSFMSYTDDRPQSTEEHPFAGNRRFLGEKNDLPDTLKLINVPEVLDHEHILYSEHPEEAEPPSPIVAYSEAMQLSSGGRRPLLKDETKERIYEYHKTDPDHWTVARLAQTFSLRQSRVRAILLQKEKQWEEVARHGPHILHPELAIKMEETCGAVDTYEDPELLLDEMVELNQHAPSSPLFEFIDGAAKQKQATKHLWKEGRKQRHYYLAPEDIPRTPTPKTPPPIYLDPGLTRGLPPPKRRTMYANWDDDVHPFEYFAIIRETDGTIRTPTFEERLRYLYLPMHNLLPERFRRPENASKIDAPIPNTPEYDKAPPTYIGTPGDWSETETLLRMVNSVAAGDKVTMDEAFSRIIQGTQGEQVYHATETASHAIADSDFADESSWRRNGANIDPVDEEFLERFTGPVTAEELQLEAFAGLSKDDHYVPDDLCQDVGDTSKGSSKFINFGEMLDKQQTEDNSPPTGPRGRRGPPPTIPSWLTQDKYDRY